MDTSALVAAMRRRREVVVELGELVQPPAPGLAVIVLRPEEADFHRFIGGQVGVEAVIDYAHDWRGFTEDVLLGGGGQGASDEVRFSRELWGPWVRDRGEVAGAVASAIANAVSDHLVQRAAVRKNSEPSSTPAPAASSSRAPKPV